MACLSTPRRPLDRCLKIRRNSSNSSLIIWTEPYATTDEVCERLVLIQSWRGADCLPSAGSAANRNFPICLLLHLPNSGDLRVSPVRHSGRQGSEPRGSSSAAVADLPGGPATRPGTHRAAEDDREERGRRNAGHGRAYHLGHSSGCQGDLQTGPCRSHLSMVRPPPQC